MANRVLLIEPYPHHGHVLFPQCQLLLEHGYTVDVITPTNFHDADLLASLDNRIAWQRHGNMNNLLNLTRLAQKISRNHYDWVLFNTLESTRHFAFANLIQHPLRLIIHDLRRYPGGNLADRQAKQRILNRAERIFVISDGVHQVAQQQFDSTISDKVHVFSPIHFGDFAPSYIPEELSHDRVRFVVVGAVDDRRRNYQSIVTLLEQLAHSPLRDRITIQLLGDFMWQSGRELVYKASQYGLVPDTIELQLEQFTTFKSLASKLRHAHFILPLIDDQIELGAIYNRQKSTSSLIHSQAFHLTLVSSQDFAIDDALRPFTLFYESDQLWSGLQQGVEIVDSGAYTKLRQEYASYVETILQPQTVANYL